MERNKEYEKEIVAAFKATLLKIEDAIEALNKVDFPGKPGVGICRALFEDWFRVESLKVFEKYSDVLSEDRIKYNSYDGDVIITYQYFGSKEVFRVVFYTSWIEAILC